MENTEKKEKNKGGRPLKFPSVEIFRKRVDEYFKECDKSGRPYTLTGLGEFLDGTSRKVLLDYRRRGDEYSEILEKAMVRIERYVEEQLFRKSQIAGVIFNLKNNFGWTDVQKHEVTGEDGKPIEHKINLEEAKRAFMGEDKEEEEKENT